MAAVHAQSPDPWQPSLTQYRHAIHGQFGWTNRALDNRCRPSTRWEDFTKLPLAAVLPSWRDDHLRYAKARHYRAQNLSSLCSPTAIIRAVFPAATEDAALRVSYCETGGTYDIYATNASSGAAGLFQLMPFHWQGKFDPYDPWANSRYAYQLSSGGWDWGAWVCQP